MKHDCDPPASTRSDERVSRVHTEGSDAQRGAQGENPRIGWDEPPDDGTLDEFVAFGVKLVHFEALDDCRWYANIELYDGQLWTLDFGSVSSRARGYANAELVDQIARMPRVTADVVSRARQALDGITPGPWEHRVGPPDETPGEYFTGTLIGDGEPLHVLIAPSADPEFAYVVPAITGDGPTSGRNAEFIAAAPGLVAELADEVERLTAESAFARDEVHLRPMTEVESVRHPPGRKL